MNGYFILFAKDPAGLLVLTKIPHLRISTPLFLYCECRKTAGQLKYKLGSSNKIEMIFSHF